MKLSSSTKKLLIRVVLFLLYIILGATIFMFIEQEHEARERGDADEFIALRNSYTANSSLLRSDEEMAKFLLKLKHALKYGYDISRNELSSPKWSFMNSFYFVGNIVTTIGYGHMVPETVGGRLFCIVYALFGIPLTALMLRSVGNRITEWIIGLLRMLDRRIYNRETENAEIKSAVIAFVLLWIMIFLPSVVYWRTEDDWEYVEAIYYCFVTFSTIGFGDLVPKSLREDGEVSSHVFVEFADLLYLVIGLAVMSSVVVSISGVIESKTQLLVDPMEAFRRIDMENLNSVAIKKLGLKMNGAADGRTMSNGQLRRPSEIANGLHAANRRSSRFSNWDEHVTKPPERSSADRIEHVGPAPVISIARQPTTSRVTDSNSLHRTISCGLNVPVDVTTSSPSISPQPPPVFKSNKITPVEKKGHAGRVNSTYCENQEESEAEEERAVSEKEDGDTDESSVTGLYDLQDEADKIMQLYSTESFKLRETASHGGATKGDPLENLDV